MNIKDFQASLDYLFAAQVTGFVWGHAGIGKSSIVKQYADRKGYHFFPMYLGTQSDLGDILGLADFKRDKNGTAIATTFATPVWLKDAIDYCENNPNSGAIIFLDEFNRARRDILNGIFALALDKTFHTIKLPKNCHVIAAGNPPVDGYFVTDVDDTALMARFVHIKLEPSVDEWVNYANETKINPELIGFIQEQPQLLEEARATFELPIKVDRRAYERVNKIMSLNPPAELMDQLMSGILGIERTVAFQLYRRNAEKALTGLEVLTGERYSLLKKWSNSKDVKAALISTSCDNLIAELTNHDKTETALSKDYTKQMVAFLTTIPKDMAYMVIHKLVTTECLVFKTASQIPEVEKVLVSLVHAAKGKKEGDKK